MLNLPTIILIESEKEWLTFLEKIETFTDYVWATGQKPTSKGLDPRPRQYLAKNTKLCIRLNHMEKKMYYSPYSFYKKSYPKCDIVNSNKIFKRSVVRF